MYCPRCGSQNVEAIKFCRQCGLSLQQITCFVEAGGTGTLQPSSARPANAPMPLLESSEMLVLRQKRIMAILAICITPVLVAIIGEEFFKIGDIAGLPFLLVPFGLMWAIFHFRIKIRQLQEAQLREHYAMQQAASQQLISGLGLSPQLSPPQTNPLNVANPGRSSVIEDETKKLPISNRSGQ